MNDSREKPPEFQRATFDDVPEIARLSRKFYGERCGIYGIPYDHASTLALIDRVVRHGICLVGRACAAGAYLEKFPPNQAFVVATIHFWHFQGHRGLRIFHALAEECRTAGATHLMAASQFPTNTISRFYCDHGLHPAETMHIGLIENCCNATRKG